jgi:hypothetical protein
MESLFTLHQLTALQVEILHRLLALAETLREKVA